MPPPSSLSLCEIDSQTCSPDWQLNCMVERISWFFLVILLTGSVTVSGQEEPESCLISLAEDEVTCPMSVQQRFRWVVKSTAGPESLTAGLLMAGMATGRDTPEEYGPHWDGFSKRYGMRLTGMATSSVLEAGFGALWNEDPRYFRATDQPVKGRIRNIVVMTFAARRADGSLAPAYARYIGKTGGNFLSNTWRADGAASLNDACVRTAFGFLGRMGSNAFAEFWPDVRKHIFHRKH
jgi:hypothetical protein